jgi:hypothetical protein
VKKWSNFVSNNITNKDLVIIDDSYSSFDISFYLENKANNKIILDDNQCVSTNTEYKSSFFVKFKENSFQIDTIILLKVETFDQSLNEIKRIIEN